MGSALLFDLGVCLKYQCACVCVCVCSCLSFPAHVDGFGRLEPGEWFLIFRFVQCCFFRMDVSQWRRRLAHRGGLPADLEDASRMYPEVTSICCKRHCYGILLLFLALKMPTARNVFLQCWKDQSYESSVEKVFATLSKFASSMSGKSLEEDTKEIGGPLYAHGWQVLLRQLYVIGGSGRGRVLVLGNTGTTVRLQKISDRATLSIRSWLDLHVSVFAVIKLGPPSTVEEWGFRACILYEAFQFHQVPGMLVGRESYSCQWLVRTFMVSFMRSEHVPNLKIAWFDKITQFEWT